MSESSMQLVRSDRISLRHQMQVLLSASCSLVHSDSSFIDEGLQEHCSTLKNAAMLSRDTELLRYTSKFHDFSQYNMLDYLVTCTMLLAPTMRNVVCKLAWYSPSTTVGIHPWQLRESMQLVFIISHRLTWRYWMRSLEVYLHASCSLVHFDSFLVKDQRNTLKNVILSRDAEFLVNINSKMSFLS